VGKAERLQKTILLGAVLEFHGKIKARQVDDRIMQEVNHAAPRPQINATRAKFGRGSLS
jgi:hypothetical protein